MVGRKELLITTVLIIISLVAVIADAQTRTISTDNTAIRNEIFIGNQSAGGERYSFVTVIFKKDAPEHVIREVYSRLEQLYTQERVINVEGTQTRAKEVRISKLVRDKDGRYMFRVAERPDVIQRYLSAYANFIERTISKPVPSTMRISPDRNIGERIGTTDALVRDLIGVTRAESVYGTTGQGVNIAVIDTGVDYGHPDLTTALRYWSGRYKGDSITEPLVLDADQQQVLILQEVRLFNATHIYVGGTSYVVLIPYPVYIYPPCDFYRVSPTLAQWLSSGGSARFGITYMIRYDRIVIRGVLLLRLPGWTYYGHAVVDVEGKCVFDVERRPPADPYVRSHFLRYDSNRIIASDFNGDGFPDESLGVAGGFFYDWWWWFSYPAEIHPGWDKQGRWLSIFYDFDGHGTSAASACCGRGVVSFPLISYGWQDADNRTGRLITVLPYTVVTRGDEAWVEISSTVGRPRPSIRLMADGVEGGRTGFGVAAIVINTERLGVTTQATFYIDHLYTPISGDTLNNIAYVQFGIRLENGTYIRLYLVRDDGSGTTAIFDVIDGHARFVVNYTIGSGVLSAPRGHVIIRIGGLSRSWAPFVNTTLDVYVGRGIVERIALVVVDYHYGSDKWNADVAVYWDNLRIGTRLPGVAREAGVVGIKALWVGNVEVGMLWAAGFDVDPYTGSFYYTGTPRARILSNSWGISYFAYDVGAFGYDLESVLVAGLTLPGFLDPRYPGVLIVQAGGNGGPGYGTITSPGAAPGVLTVGASTMTYFAFQFTRQGMAEYSSGAGWTGDDIISWSLRGPTVVGYIKPDVVNVGAFGYTAAPVGINYTLFGGTSYATPLTAGVAALVYQVLPTADPALVKSIITSTADFIRYDSASQGAGRVNAFRAVSLARLLAGRTVARYELQFFSNSLWQQYTEKARNIWQWQWCDNIRSYMLWWVGTDFVPPSCTLPTTASSRIDSTLFFGDVQQGGSRSITLTVRNPTNRTVSISVSPRQFNLTRSISVSRNLGLAPYAEFNRTYIVFTSTNLTTTLRYLEAVATIPYSRFDSDNDYSFDIRVRVWIHLWRSDANNNGRPDPEEMILVNYGYNRYNWNSATMANPAGRLSGHRGIVISVDIVRGPDTPYSDRVPPVPITITVNTIDSATDPWVSASPTSATIPPGGSATITLTVRVPTNAVPTTYIGELVVTNNLTGVPNAIPYSFNVFTTVDTAWRSLTSGVARGWPSPTTIRGAGNWRWRFEAGDWRWFHVKPNIDSALALEFTGSWSLPDTSLIAFAVGPDGQFAGALVGQGASWFRYLGSGVFTWVNTGAGSIQNARRVVIFPAVDYRLVLYPHSKPETGIFTLVLRSTLFDGASGAAERINATARVIRAQQKLPSSVSSGNFIFRFSLPYLAGPLHAYAIRAYTPILDFDQQYTCVNYYITPPYVSGTWPAGTTFTFQVNIHNCGAPGQKVDISTLYRVNLPSLPVFSRILNQYYRERDWYWLEDWTSSQQT